MSSSIAQAVRILGWQVVGLLALALLAWAYDARFARSLLAGGGIGLLASAYLAFVLIKHSLRPARPATVLSLFGNWLVKTALVLGLLAIALRSRALQPAALLLGLVCSLLIYWLAVVVRPRVRDEKR